MMIVRSLMKSLTLSRAAKMVHVFSAAIKTKSSTERHLAAREREKDVQGTWKKYVFFAKQHPGKARQNS